MNELLLGRYEMPKPKNPDSLLARHEAGMFAELRHVLKSAPGHRSEEVNRLVLPYCQPMMEAIGHRMAYDAAVEQGVRPALIDLYVANVMKLDAAWYVEFAGLGRAAQQAMETRAMDAVLPMLGELVKEMDVFAYINAPLVSDERWAAFVDDMKTHEGNGRVDLFNLPRRPVAIQPEMVRSHL